MVFSSVPVYLDPPSWQQQQEGLVSNENLQLPPLPPLPHGGAGSIKPGSMADRARLAKIPQPEPGLNCPRCESTNTKFCYFNNYSLTQPRHFCKNCRRYWTRGGALRNVPVGGGCRRNKKSKTQSSSKSPVSGAERQPGSNPNSTSELMAQLPSQPSQLPFMPSLHSLAQFGMGSLGLNFSGIHGGATSGTNGESNDMGFQLGSNNSGMSTNGSILSGGGVQQFPFFDPQPTGLYPFDGVEAAPPSMNSSSRVSQFAPVKMEENHHQRLNLTRPFTGVSENNQFWNANPWTDLSGLNSSSTTTHLDRKRNSSTNQIHIDHWHGLPSYAEPT